MKRCNGFTMMWFSGLTRSGDGKEERGGNWVCLPLSGDFITIHHPVCPNNDRKPGEMFVLYVINLPCGYHNGNVRNYLFNTWSSVLSRPFLSGAEPGVWIPEKLSIGKSLTLSQGLDSQKSTIWNGSMTRGYCFINQRWFLASRNVKKYLKIDWKYVIKILYLAKCKGEIFL